jgi:hypothetical protein
MVREVILKPYLASDTTTVPFKEASSASNKVLSIHRWVNWIAGFSGDFVQSAIKQYITYPSKNDIVLDPFAGVGTTLVEAFRSGINCIGFEINPFAALVSQVKLQAVDIDLIKLQQVIEQYREYMTSFEQDGQMIRTIPRNSVPSGFHTRIPFFSKSIERKVLLTLDFMDEIPPSFKDIFKVALGSVLVEFSNYTYEPSLGSRPGAGKSLVESAPVGEIINNKLNHMIEDIELLQQTARRQKYRTYGKVYPYSYFSSDKYLKPGSVDLVVTSPPYMNNYHYVRNTRPQLYWITLTNTSQELKKIEEANFGKYWQTVRSNKKIDIDFILPELEQQIAEIRMKNGEKGVYGGNGWANYISGYMNDLNLFVKLLSNQLRPKTGVAVIVLGNSVIQGTHVPLQKYTAQLAEMNNLDPERIDILRSRVGSSIVNSGTRISGDIKHKLYDYAIVIRKN